MAVDSSGATITGNTIEDNQYAGVVFDLAWWDSDEDGVAQLGLTGNTIRGHNNRRQIISQSIPAGANVDGFAALHAEQVVVAQRRCGDGQVDAGEDCDALGPVWTVEGQHAAAHGRAICIAHAEGDIRCIGKSGLSSAAFGPNWNEEGDRNAFRPSPTPAVSTWRSVIAHGCWSNEMARCGAAWTITGNTVGGATTPPPRRQDARLRSSTPRTGLVLGSVR